MPVNLVLFICTLLMAQETGEGSEVVGLVQVKGHFFNCFFLTVPLDQAKASVLDLPGSLIFNGFHS